MKQPLIILTGPTAAGKTALSLALARNINGAVISADSMQVYRGLDIGSAKITAEEMCGIPHYLVDVLEPEESFNVYRFQKMAEEAMAAIYAEGRIPVVTGGTGFYIQALLRSVDFSESSGASSVRAELEAEAERIGSCALHEKLAAVDPDAAAAIHPNNRKRVIRALEFYLETGKQISVHNAQQHANVSPYQYVYFVLTDARAKLYEKIDRRVDQMIEAGLEAEVRALYERGLTENHLSMKGLGYREWFPYFAGEQTRDEVIRRIKLDTRHFAKRQLTWFRREPDVIWLDKSAYGYDEAAILSRMLQICRDKQIYVYTEE